MVRWVMEKSTSLWLGSETQVEVCARARGAASARIPVIRAKRFIFRSSFRFRGHRVSNSRGSALKSADGYQTRQGRYSLQQIFLKFEQTISTDARLILATPANGNSGESSARCGDLCGAGLLCSRLCLRPRLRLPLY